MSTEFCHEWRDCEVGCEDCGTHPGVVCDNPDCPCDGEAIDLCREDDPREV